MGYRLAGVQVPARDFFLFSVESRPVLGPTSLTVQWVLGGGVKAARI
jgi:hypothetical protein